MTGGVAEPNDTPNAAGAEPPAPRRALALAGGGMRVAWQAGAVRALYDAGLRFAHGDGASGGTMNLAMLLAGLSPEEMCARWTTLDVHAFATPMPTAAYLDAPHLMAMGSADGVVGTVFPHLGIDVARVRAATAMTGSFNVCDFGRKTAEVIPHDDVDLDLLVAGISLPIFMPPVRARGTTWTDAVWIRDTNLTECVRRGAEELWLLWCIGNTPTYYPGAFRQYVHMIEMSAAGALNEELARLDALNRRIAAGEPGPGGQTRPVTLHVVAPRYPLPLDPDFYLGRVDARTLVAMGYADGVRALAGYLADQRAGRAPAGVPLTPEATRMQDEPLGVTFREVMHGGFAFGETDPAAGAARGAREGTALELHAAVTVHDVPRFVADPAHAGELVGTVDVPGLGAGIPGARGVFNLFRPGESPGLKLMVYELAFTHAGRPYYLAGRKEVHDDPGFDMLRDTTTLFTRLHEGEDATGAVVGAGVLRLDARDLTALLSTMRPVGAHDAADGAAALATFARFFAGELLDTYGGALGGVLGRLTRPAAAGAVGTVS